MTRGHHIFVRPARDNDGQMYFDWMKENEDKNAFDPAVATYPSSNTFCAYDKNGPVAYQTVQRPLVLESFAPRPGATDAQKAIALRELTQNAVTQAHIAGVGEIWFLGSDPETDEFATNQIFERVPYPVYRVKVRELEGL